MTNTKFKSEVDTLKEFFEYYCKHNHKEKNLFIKSIDYKDNCYIYEFQLCSECIEDISYSINRLENCIHEDKPRCRKCPSPCYDKIMWKKIAKVMRYSGIMHKVDSIKDLFRF